jgi:hypothetical protein
MLTMGSRIAVVIGTHGTPPYVHLQLESLARNEPGAVAAVHDDCSGDGDALRALCDRYGATFASTSRRLGHFAGDFRVMAAGLRFAEAAGADLLVKLSRRFVPLLPWSGALLQLAEASQYATYSGHDTPSGYGFVSGCFAVDVRRWTAAGAVALLEGYDGGPHPETEMHNIAKHVHAATGPNPTTEAYEREHPKHPDRTGYGAWPLIDDAQRRKTDDKLWKDVATVADYQAVASAWGLPYTIDELTIDR